MIGAGEAKASAEKFWDRLAKRYARQPVADEAAYQEKLRMTRDYLRPDMELLEIGCGTGSTALLHAPHVRHIRAVDISGAMIEIARAKAETARITNVSFEQAALETLEAPDGSCDAVLALSILHLLEDRQAVLRKVNRWLKPGGILVSSTVCIADSPGILKFLLPVLTLVGLAPRIKLLTLAGLRQDHEDAGFRIEREWQPGPGKAVFIIARKPA